jgi:hypothetical protein
MNFLKDMDPITMTLILLGIANTMNKNMTNTNLPVTGLEIDIKIINQVIFYKIY